MILYHILNGCEATKVVDLPQGFNRSVDIVLENPIDIPTEMTLCIRFKLERESSKVVKIFRAQIHYIISVHFSDGISNFVRNREFLFPRV